MVTPTRVWQALRLAAVCCAWADAALAEEPALRHAEPALRATEPARGTELQAVPRLALELVGKPEAAHWRGAFRIQLNDSASLALRPRGGGLVVAFRSQF